MTEASPPLVPADVDLRNFPFMPLDVVRLRDSDLVTEPDGDIFRANVLSWCIAWHQVPAASLPDDDATLARLLGYGRDLRGWRKARAAGGLRGWVKCADGRLYHPVVAEKALAAWDKKQAQRQRTEAARKALADRREITLIADFKVWYAKYPSKVAPRKAEAAYLWARRRGASAEDLLAGVDRYMETKPDYHDWANPAAWLNGDRWLDGMVLT